ncbi:transposase [Enterococcus sp. LJL128]
MDGFTEGLNNKMKDIQRAAYGYRNCYHFRSRIYLVQGLFFSKLKGDTQPIALQL